MKEQTSREDILPRKIVAAVKKRLWYASVSRQGYVVQYTAEPKAWIARDQEIFTIKEASDK
jgi:hypothetical protein